MWIVVTKITHDNHVCSSTYNVLDNYNNPTINRYSNGTLLQVNKTAIAAQDSADTAGSLYLTSNSSNANYTILTTTPPTPIESECRSLRVTEDGNSTDVENQANVR